MSVTWRLPDGSPGQILDLMPRVASSVGALAKTTKAKDLPYRFRSIDDLLIRLQPALIEYGVTTCYECTHLRREQHGKAWFAEVLLRLDYVAPDGSYISTVAAGEARDHSDKAVNKAITAAIKNAHLHTLQVPTGTKRDTEYAPEKVRWSRKSAAVIAQIEKATDPEEVHAIMDGPAYKGVPESERDDVRQIAVSRYKQLTARRLPGGPDD